MLDKFNRNINYLRISITDRCNLRCLYCMPEEGINLITHNEIITFEEINDFVKIAVDYGINKVRITGGEPLVRKGAVNLVKMLSDINGIKDLSITTNGILLENYAKDLFNAGLKRINISLDTINSQKYCSITRGGDINKVFRGIEAAKEAGLNPIKINCVIKESVDEIDAVEVKNYCLKNNLQVRFIHQMDLEKGNFTTVVGGDGGNCESCNRLRLTSNGKLKPCLFNDLELDIRKLGYEEAIKQAIFLKPECGTFNIKSNFYNIGG